MNTCQAMAHWKPQVLMLQVCPMPVSPKASILYNVAINYLLNIALVRTPSPFVQAPQEQTKLASFIVDGDPSMFPLDPQLFVHHPHIPELGDDHQVHVSPPVIYLTSQEETTLREHEPFIYDPYAYLATPSWTEHDTLVHSPAFSTDNSLSPHSNTSTPPPYSSVEYSYSSYLDPRLPSPVAWDSQIPRTPSPPSHGYLDLSLLGLAH